VQEYIEMVELEGFEDHYPYQLSGGMQRRAELARAIVVNPDILIMDEPFSGLDFLTHMKIREEVVNMHELFGKTTLVVTHDIDDALVMGDRIVVMSGRPSSIKLERKLDFPHPRNFSFFNKHLSNYRPPESRIDPAKSSHDIIKKQPYYAYCYHSIHHIIHSKGISGI